MCLCALCVCSVCLYLCTPVCRGTPPVSAGFQTGRYVWRRVCVWLRTCVCFGSVLAMSRRHVGIFAKGRQCVLVLPVMPLRVVRSLPARRRQFYAGSTTTPLEIAQRANATHAMTTTSNLRSAADTLPHSPPPPRAAGTWGAFRSPPPGWQQMTPTLAFLLVVQLPGCRRRIKTAGVRRWFGRGKSRSEAGTVLPRSTSAFRPTRYWDGVRVLLSVRTRVRSAMSVDRVNWLRAKV